MSIGVKFVGNPEDHTGYGRAGMYMLEAMHSAGIQVSLRAVRFLSDKMNLPKHIEDMKSAIVRYNYVIIELTPEHFPIYRESGKYNIGYFFWEADRIPDEWVRCCNMMNEIWVPCQSNKNACINSGVTVPVKVVPQPTPMDHNAGKILVPGITSSTYIFYSIFQWTARKNPECLLNAYFKAFHSGEDVILLLKTYHTNDSDKDIKMIMSSIDGVRNKAAGSLRIEVGQLPKIYFLSKIISDSQIMALQNTGHCFVTAARGEGWNIPAAIAMFLQQPIISPSYGGVVDFLKPTEYYPVDCKNMIPVSGMPWIKWYESNQNWCDPSYTSLAKNMRKVFDRNVRLVSYPDNIMKSISIVGVGRLIHKLLSSGGGGK